MTTEYDIIDDTETMAKKRKGDAWKFDKLADAIVDSMCEQGKYPLYHKETFYTWDGRRYVEETELDSVVRKWLRANNKPQSNNIVGNVKPIVEKCLAQKLASTFGDLPFYVGKESFPAPSQIIAYRNGLLDIGAYIAGDVKLIPHTAKWISTFCLPFDFNPDARCPMFEDSLLAQNLEGDEGRIKPLQEYTGYCLANDNTMKKLLVLNGTFDSGKSLYMKVAQGLVGNDNWTGYDLPLLAERFGLSPLLGKMVAFIGEVDLAKCRDKYQIFSMLKRITGGDPVTIDRKNLKQISTVLPTRFVMACNEMPSFNDPTGAVSSRMLVVDFPLSYTERPNPGLGEQLLSELSGINNWALQGYARLKANGKFTESALSKHLVNAYRRETSWIFGFMQDRLIVERRLNPGNLSGVELTDKPQSAQGKNLQAAYQEWCEANYKTYEGSSFIKSLKAIMPKFDRPIDQGGIGEAKRKQVGGIRDWVYQGIGATSHIS